MSLFCCPAKHADNPPSTWQVRTAWQGARVWVVVTKDDEHIASAPSKTEALHRMSHGFFVNMYAQETAWYAGQPIIGWRPYEPRECPNRHQANHPKENAHA